jgi:hypothetical protein
MNLPQELFFSQPGRFPHPDWDAIASLIEADATAGDPNCAWSDVALRWMGFIATELGASYRIHPSENFLVVSEADPARMREILSFLEDCHQRILRSLPFVERGKFFGKCPVIIFARDDDFYEYLAGFHGDEDEGGEFGAVGGVYLNRGYGHFAMPSERLDYYRATMCHELCHAFLSPFDLPLWLDEAITGEVEHNVVGGNPYFLDRETVREHREYWDDERLAAFWSGDSFWFPDAGQRLSYHLARYLFNALASHSTPETMTRFIHAAAPEDAGISAAIEVFGIDLMEVLAGLLDDGPEAQADD